MPARHPRILLRPRLAAVIAGMGLLALGTTGPAAARPSPVYSGAAHAQHSQHGQTRVQAGSAERAGRTAATVRGSATSVVLPVDGPVTRFFVRPPERWSRGHRGVDLAAEPGTPVRSPVTGVVEFAGPVAGRTVLTVVRADGLRCSLEPLTDVAEVGTVVTAGDVVAAVAAPSAPGAAHCGATSCLHWGARRDGEYVDPLGLLEATTVVLLPWP